MLGVTQSVPRPTEIFEGAHNVTALHNRQFLGARPMQHASMKTVALIDWPDEVGPGVRSGACTRAVCFASERK